MIGEDINHVGAVLAGAKNPINFVCGRIVAADGFGSFCSEPELASHKRETVRTAESAKINRRQRLLVHEVGDGDGVVGSAAIIGDVGDFSVSRGDDLMRVGACRNFGNNGKRGWIHDGQGLIAFRKDQQGSLRSFGRVQQSR